MNKVTFKKVGLNKLRAQIATLGTARAQVGIFADQDSRTPTEPGRGDSNASVGFAHEFGVGEGSQHLPRRSFLQMPLELHLPGELARTSSDQWFDSLQRGGVRSVLHTMGKTGEELIQQAFDSGGFGNWPQLADETVLRKESAAILIETNQLRDSISVRVV